MDWTVMDAIDRPIGYWLRHLHNLIENRFTATLGGQGLTRRHWQLLHQLAEGPRGQRELANALAPFGDDTTALDDLRDRGWVAADGAGRCSLTGPGRQAHAELATQVAETRRLLVRGIGPHRYAKTVRTLAEMAANLEAADER